MEFEEVVGWVEDLPGGPYAVLGAAVVGLVGAVVLCYALGCSGGSKADQREGEKKRTVSESDSAGEEASEEQGKSKQQSRGKGSKHFKQQSKKVTLPPHPLLATEFKGHTGTVLSLDFDVNGKFLASCSDGKLLKHLMLSGSAHLKRCYCFLIVRSNHPVMVHEDCTR